MSDPHGPAARLRLSDTAAKAVALNVVFNNPSGASFSLGPLTQLYLRGHELRETSNSPVLAVEEHGRWKTDGGLFSRFDCDVECHVTLTRDRDGASKRYGPYSGFSSIAGIKFVDHQLFCLCDESTKDFYGYQSGEHWDAIIVAPT